MSIDTDMRVDNPQDERVPSDDLPYQCKNLAEIHTGIAGVSAQDLQTLLVFARRIAFNADEKIDELLLELKKEDEQQQ